MRKNKVKNPEAVGAKECIGVTALSTMGGVAAIFMSTMFMQYMTDYAGLGAWGASLATILLLVARLFDAVDRPRSRDLSWTAEKLSMRKVGSRSS